MATLFFVTFLSVPFYFIWNALAPTYFYQLPAIYQHLPFWHCAGLFALIAILRLALLPHFHFHGGHQYKWKRRWNCET